MITEILQGFLPYLPYFVFIALALGVLLVIFLVFLAQRTVSKALKQKTKTRAPQPLQSKEASFLERFLTLKSTFKNKLSNLSWGRLPKDEMSNSFRQTEEIIKTYLGSREPQYELPWYLLIGAEGSGKTTLLKNLNLELPIGKPAFEIPEEHAKLIWRFYDGAVVLEPNGPFILRENSLSSDNQDWEYLLQLLNRFRPKRPLDGIILTLPCDELVSSTRLSHNEIYERAKVIYTKLWELQSILGIKIPIYVVLTKSDIMSGFQSFVEALPIANSQEILGWSCPYSVDANYLTSWVDEAFRYIHRTLDRLRASIFTARKTQSHLIDGVFTLPLEFIQLKENLQIYLDQIFKGSAYHESFFLRGIYLTGRTFIDSIVAPSLLPKLNTDFNLNNEKEFQNPLSERIYFITDLFEKKIFSESTLAQPIMRILVSTNRILNYAKATAAAIGIVWFMGLIFAHDNLKTGLNTTMPALIQIDKSIQGVSLKGGVSDDPRFLAYLNQQVDIILEKFTAIDTVNVGSIFIPASWFSPLNDNIRLAFSAAYDRIILPSLYSAIIKKAEDIVSLKKLEYPSSGYKQSATNILLSQPFLAIKNYVQQIQQLEQQVHNFNNLEHSRNIQDLATLIKYLFNKDLPSQFYTSADYYSSALSMSLERPIDLSPFKVGAGQKLGIIYKNFIEHAFNLDESFPIFASISRKLIHLSDSAKTRTYKSEDLRKIVEETITAADIISSGSLNWADKDVFDPGPGYSSLINQITTSTLLGKDIASELNKISEREFIKFKLALASFTTPLTGPLFSLRNGQLISDPSPGLIHFIDYMSMFLDEPFMMKSVDQQMITKVPAGKLLFWDDLTLQKAGKIIENFDDFMAQRLNNMPPALQNIMKLIGRNSMRQCILNYVAQSQVLSDGSTNNAGLGARELLQAQVLNITKVVPIFARIFSVFDEGGLVTQNTKLRQLLVNESQHILQKIEKMLESDDLYAACEDMFVWWDGSSMVGLKAFGVRDLNDMKTFLKAQRVRISFLAKELAEPILSLLSIGYLEDIPFDIPLVDWWTRIIKAIDDYEKKTPGSSLVALEHFLTYDINEITLENCASLDLQEDFIGLDDYFVDIRNTITQQLKKRCKNVTIRRAFEHYNKAATFFNTNLAGRFPFSRKLENAESFEADQNDVATFFELFDTLDLQEISSLEKYLKTTGSTESEAIRFIKDIQSIRTLMLAAIDQGLEQAPSKVDFDVSFRTDRKREAGGDKIIDWSMQVGAQILDFRQKNLSASWSMGMPIIVDLRWAMDGDLSPLSDPRRPSLTVIGPKASFAYTGRWSLIKLIKEHVSYESEPSSAKTSPSSLLEFVIPTTCRLGCSQEDNPLAMERKTTDSRVYLRIALHDTDKPKKGEKNTSHEKVPQKLKCIALPRFPVQAPLLDSFVLREQSLKRVS
ncbi:hypothetical protein IM40_07540 [Candidatus Paracaedimonas acanthamoebae]|nr:hypothetical protein IM40_07540 [Candidatus Paracaedimonas acanthamoebae]